MFARVFCLSVAFVAALGLMSGSSAASATVHRGGTIDVSTRAAVVDYLRSIHIDPRGVVIERGLRNYAGPNCPGRGWSCTSTTHPVVQVASAGGANTFRCSTASCAVVQVAAPTVTATNLAVCIMTMGLMQACTISQASSKANNKAVVYERIGNSTGTKSLTPSTLSIAQRATATVSITQKATGGDNAANSNEACVYQAINLVRSGTFQKQTVNLTQAAHQTVTITQDSANGGNSAAESANHQGQCTGSSITQRQTVNSNLSVPESLTQNQNAGNKGANITVDIEQNQHPNFLGTASGENSANLDQYSSLTAIANSPDGPVSQTQSSGGGGLLGTVNQDSQDPSTANATQTQLQCEDAATSGLSTCHTFARHAPSALTQTQFGPARKSGGTTTQVQTGIVRKGVGTATQTGNDADTFTVNQATTQNNLTGTGQTSVIQGDCTTAGNCNVTQDTAVNGQTTHNTQSGKTVNTTTDCTGSQCTKTSGRVYFVNNDGTVNAVPRAGGSVTTLATGDSPVSVAVDGTNVYWVDYADGTVNEVPLGGGSVTTLASGQDSPAAVAVDGTHVYWVDAGTNPGTGSVNEVPLGGGSVTTLASGQDDPLSVAVDGTSVYWVNFSEGTVKDVPLGGGSVTTLASGQNGPFSVAVDGTNVYWVNNGDGTVNEVPLGGGSVTTLASGQDGPVSVAVDGTNVYWVNIGSGVSDGSVNEVPLGGGGVTTLASGQDDPLSVAVDGTSVYWVNSSGGTVNAVPLGGGSVTAVASGQDGPLWVALGP